MCLYCSVTPAAAALPCQATSKAKPALSMACTADRSSCTCSDCAAASQTAACEYNDETVSKVSAPAKAQTPGATDCTLTGVASTTASGSHGRSGGALKTLDQSVQALGIELTGEVFLKTFDVANAFDDHVPSLPALSLIHI